MKLSHLQEAKYYKQHPWYKEFFGTFYDPDEDPTVKIPRDLDLDEVIRAITDVFGEVKEIKWHGDINYEWKTSLKGRNNEGFEIAYITLDPGTRELFVEWN